MSTDAMTNVVAADHHDYSEPLVREHSAPPTSGELAAMVMQLHRENAELKRRIERLENTKIGGHGRTLSMMADSMIVNTGAR